MQMNGNSRSNYIVGGNCLAHRESPLTTQLDELSPKVTPLPLTIHAIMDVDDVVDDVVDDESNCVTGAADNGVSSDGDRHRQPPPAQGQQQSTTSQQPQQAQQQQQQSTVTALSKRLVVGQAQGQHHHQHHQPGSSPGGTIAVAQSAGGQTVAVQQATGGQQQQQTIAVSQQPGGPVKIVQLQLPVNQPQVVQSVIQPNQQSVIQIVTSKSDADDGGQTISPIIFGEDESKRRREILARRPSYRKILNDLSSAVDPVDIKGDPDDDRHRDQQQQHQQQQQQQATITVGAPYLKVLPASAIQLVTGSQDGSLQGIPTLTMTNAGAAGAGTIVQYATQGQDGQFYVPVTVSAADLQTYQIRTPGGGPTAITPGVVMASPGGIPSQQQIAEEASKKRELRLLKNREAAKECRRKKKEYIKCLENRVAVLENQNKALIEELKSLKELYCQKSD